MHARITVILPVLLTVLAGCSPSPKAIATRTSITVATVANVTASAPMPGHWKGESHSEVSPQSVSFDIGPDGNIHNFRYAIYVGFGSEAEGCVITAENISVGPDGDFSYTFGTPRNEGDNVLSWEV